MKVIEIAVNSAPAAKIAGQAGKSAGDFQNLG
jgi:hypothetical protein